MPNKRLRQLAWFWLTSPLAPPLFGFEKEIEAELRAATAKWQTVGYQIAPCCSVKVNFIPKLYREISSCQWCKQECACKSQSAPWAWPQWNILQISPTDSFWKFNQWLSWEVFVSWALESKGKAQLNDKKRKAVSPKWHINLLYGAMRHCQHILLYLTEIHKHDLN